METKKKKVTNAANIGQEITQNDYNFLKKNYQKIYDDQTSFLIPKSLIAENLTFNKNIAGIRFMYGLKDSLNPNSKVLFLIPCSNISGNLSSEAMLRNEGYQDHEGNTYSIQEVLLFMSQYVQNISQEHPEFAYKEITRGNFYGKDSLVNLLIDECEFIQYEMGHYENHISPIIQPLDENYQTFNEVYMDFSLPCPDSCDDDKDCVSELVLSNKENGEKQLNDYRQFRNVMILSLEGGAQLFEMYYFISPVVAKIIDNHSSKNRDIALNDFYTNEIIPFKTLLDNKQYEDALDSLKNTLYKLSEEYEYSKLFV